MYQGIEGVTDTYLITRSDYMEKNNKNIRKEVELVFEKYRKHKYYTLFMSDINVSITSKIDNIGGGRTNKISDQTASAAIKLADKKQEAKEFVEKVERAVEQLPDVERDVIKLRYMSKNHNYINDYTIYEVELPMSKPTYIKIRDRAFEKLYVMLF